MNSATCEHDKLDPEIYLKNPCDEIPLCNSKPQNDIRELLLKPQLPITLILKDVLKIIED